MYKKVLTLLIGATVLAAAPLAQGAAIALNPGDTHYKPVTGNLPVYNAGPPPAYFTAANQLATLVSPYLQNAGAPGITGQVTSWVFQDPGTGNLGFQYHFTSTGTSPLIRASLNGEWLGVTVVDAGADASGSSTQVGALGWTDGDPEQIQREATILGEDVIFQWLVGNNGTVLASGDTSSLIWLDTQAPWYKVDLVGLLDSGAASSAGVLTPGPIPEPITMIGLVMGVGGVAGYIRKRR